MSTKRSGMELEWAVIADYALVDTAGKLSILGIFGKLWTSSFPSLQPVIYVVAAWMGESNRLGSCELRAWGPSKELLVGGQQQVQLGPEGRAHGVFRLSPLPLPSAGTYVVELLADGTSAAHIDLIVEALEGA